MALEQPTEVEKDPHAATWGAGAVEQGRFRRNIYPRVVSMWQRRRREAAPWPQYCREEEGVGENGTAADRDARAAVGLLPRRRRQRERCTYTPAPGRGGPAGFVTSRE